MRRISILLVAALLVLTIAPSLMAQGFQIGSITGVVTDQTGGALPGVTVTVTNLDRKTERTEVTDSNGRYRFAGMPLATYRVEAALSGFANAVRTVHVEADKATVTDLTMKLAAASEAITVTAAAPVVDPTNQTQTTRLSNREYEKAPVGRSYQSIAGLAPGITSGTTGNPTSNGALSSANQFLFDGVDATDPTTGTFGANMNFEAIQEVNVFTSGVSAEYGRATGAIISVISKSGTNNLDGSFKTLVTNDEWNVQNKTHNQITGASLKRTKIDYKDFRYSATLGGPIWKDHAWFFGAMEKSKPYGSLATTTFTNEEFGGKRDLKLENYRATWQITPSQQVWAKFNQDPYKNIITTYPEPTDLFVVVRQGQGGKTKVGQYSGVFGSKFSLDAMFGTSTSTITVDPFKTGPFDNGAAIYDIGISKYFNGLYFGNGNFTERPKKQYVVAGTYFATLGQNTHEFKAGIDSENVESTSYYSYGNNRQYRVRNYDPKTGAFTPYQRRDYDDPGPQTSEGEINSAYVRDKFSIGRRLNLEAGMRFEKQNGHNDVGTKVVQASTYAPRLSGSYDITGNGRTLVLGTYGRYYDFIIQSFSDQYAQNASRANYSLYQWNTTTSQYDFVRKVITAGGSQLPPALGVDPNKMDEVTVGLQRQLGSTMGLTVRGVYRKWANLIEDVYGFDSTGNISTTYVNDPGAKRTYKAIQTVFDKRFSNNWSLMANYTYSQTRGNYFSNFASARQDFSGYNCRATIDNTIGNAGIIPCSSAIATYNGKASFDVPHVLNVLGTYGFKLGPVNMTYGATALWKSGFPYSKNSSVEVLDSTGAGTGITYSYYYQGLGSDRLPNIYYLDSSLEATYPFFHGVEVGLKGEVFNVTNNEIKTGTSTTTWCNATSTSCSTTRSRYGAATSRGHYLSPRSYRATFLVRF